MTATIEKEENGYTLNNILWIACENDDPGGLIAVDVEDALESGEEQLQLMENCSYEYEFLQEKMSFEELPGIVHQSKKYKHRGRLTPGNYAGRLVLYVITPSQKFPVAFEVRSKKIDYRTDYRIMLKDITEECAELLMLHSSPSSQSYSVDYEKDSSSLYQKFAFIQSMVNSDEFQSSVQKILSSPVTRWKTEYEQTDVRRLKRCTSSQIRQFASGSNRIPYPDCSFMNEDTPSLPRTVYACVKKDTLNTPENQFVKHALTEFARFSSYLCSVIEKKSALPYPVIYTEAENLEHRLQEYLNHTAFLEIENLTSLPLNNPVLQRKEGYREVFRIWLMYGLSSNLIWNGIDRETYTAGKRDIASLYEYWLFFKLLRMVKELFSIKNETVKSLITETQDGLCLQLKAGKYTAVKGSQTFNNRDFNFKFSYNRTFNPEKYPKGGSWTVPMRPDYTLSVWPSAFSEHEAEEQEIVVHIHFDAKYKVQNLDYLFREEENQTTPDVDEFENKYLTQEKEEEKRGTFKRADLLKMHAYKDAIRRTAGAYILYPGNVTREPFKGFHELIPGLGAFAVTPAQKEDGIQQVKDFILQVIENLSNRCSQFEKQSFYTYKTMKDKEITVNENFPEYSGKVKERSIPVSEVNVLIGYVKDDAHKRWIKENNLYNIRLDIPLTPQHTGAQYLLLFDKIESNAMLHYKENKLIKITAPPVVRSLDWMKENEYPVGKKPQDKYLIYELSAEEQIWSSGKIRPILYDFSVGEYRPFTKTLAELLSSKKVDSPDLSY